MSKLILFMALIMPVQSWAFGAFDFGGFSTADDTPSQVEEVVQAEATTVSNKAPSWVKQIRQGAGLRMENGTETLFRNITMGIEGQRELCLQSKEDNIGNIKGMFPLIKHIPGITLRHTYFEKGMCATTISIKRKTLDRLEKISLDKLGK